MRLSNDVRQISKPERVRSSPDRYLDLRDIDITMKTSCHFGRVRTLKKQSAGLSKIRPGSSIDEP